MCRGHKCIANEEPGAHSIHRSQRHSSPGRHHRIERTPYCEVRGCPFSRYLTKPGVTGAIVPCVRCALLIVKFHPRDQVEEPEISTFIFHHPAPFGHIDEGIWNLWVAKCIKSNHLGSPCLGCARLWEARQQGRRITDTIKHTSTIALEMKEYLQMMARFLIGWILLVLNGELFIYKKSCLMNGSLGIFCEESLTCLLLLRISPSSRSAAVAGWVATATSREAVEHWSVTLDFLPSPLALLED